MSDPLDRLTEFGSAFSGEAMPLPPEEVRRRGDRIRRRTHAMIAAGSAAAVAAVAIPVFAVMGGDGGPDEVPPATKSPTVSGSANVDAPEPLGSANLITEEDAVYTYDGLAWGGGPQYDRAGRSDEHCSHPHSTPPH